MFVNYSNHPIEKWDDEQKRRVEMDYDGDMIDVPFIAVSAYSGEPEISVLADEEVEKIMAYSPKVVMCQGEFTLAFAVINRLKERGVKCVAACSDREVKEYTDDNGEYKKEIGFKFVRFREYE